MIRCSRERLKTRCCCCGGGNVRDCCGTARSPMHKNVPAKAHKTAAAEDGLRTRMSSGTQSEAGTFRHSFANFASVRPRVAFVGTALSTVFVFPVSGVAVDSTGICTPDPPPSAGTAVRIDFFLLGKALKFAY